MKFSNLLCSSAKKVNLIWGNDLPTERKICVHLSYSCVLTKTQHISISVKQRIFTLNWRLIKQLQRISFCMKRYAKLSHKPHTWTHKTQWRSCNCFNHGVYHRSISKGNRFFQTYMHDQVCRYSPELSSFRFWRHCCEGKSIRRIDKNNVKKRGAAGFCNCYLLHAEIQSVLLLSALNH